MKKRLPRKSIFLIVLTSMIIVFAAVMLIIETLPDPLPEYKAVDDIIETNEDTALTVKVLENDIDIDKDNLSITEYTQPEHGRTAKTTTGIRYIPNVNYFGEDSFTYTVKNSRDETSTATVYITVKSVNDAPRAYKDYYTTTEDISALIDVLANDTDIDGDTLTVVSFLGLPDHGTIKIENGKVLYTPNEGYTGMDYFTYRCQDTQGSSDTALVTISVLPKQE